MKTVLLTAFALLTALGTFAQQTPGVTLTVTVENVLNDQGNVLAALHQQHTFMKGAGLAGYSSQAQKGPLTITFEDVAPGTYAISVLHDLNANGRMDFDTSGMPQEPYGLSGETLQMGPPNFQASAFEVGTEDVSLSIRF
ncbi:DUF2141 domain-containing protein [Robiginitalea sp. M366]|uniref:DUF2141 domain-containing protein n=1 Tax=Robiginitalea aestuariiviva TaxID=3036903 RepID=UPI00240D8F74|nr:DUF2141 domain-containing protein [Robiginitalea aestuariiviva]MDG1573406.1 DUF2141 domain-containing protein [Robiginitalea aestuariiviva]